MAPSPMIKYGKLDTRSEMSSSFWTLAADASSMVTLCDETMSRSTSSAIFFKTWQLTQVWFILQNTHLGRLNPLFLTSFMNMTGKTVWLRALVILLWIQWRASKAIVCTIGTLLSEPQNNEVKLKVEHGHLRESSEFPDQDVHLGSLICTHDHASSLHTDHKTTASTKLN